MRAKRLTLKGLEPSTFELEVQCANHCATRPLFRRKIESMYFTLLVFTRLRVVRHTIYWPLGTQLYFLMNSNSMVLQHIEINYLESN